jgi:hypothetical protein
MSNPQDDIIPFRLSVQRALLGMTFPSMRAVSVQMVKGIRVAWVFLDSDPTSELLECVSEIETEILADFHDNHVSVRWMTLGVGTPLPLDQGVFVYVRFDPSRGCT